eukprot:687334-Hanusia_phi.AAC.2
MIPASASFALLLQQREWGKDLASCPLPSLFLIPQVEALSHHRSHVVIFLISQKGAPLPPQVLPCPNALIKSV